MRRAKRLEEIEAEKIRLDAEKAAAEEWVNIVPIRLLTNRSCKLTDGFIYFPDRAAMRKLGELKAAVAEWVLLSPDHMMSIYFSPNLDLVQIIMASKGKATGWRNEKESESSSRKGNGGVSSFFFYLYVLYDIPNVPCLDRAKAKAELLEKENTDAELKAKAEAEWVDLLRRFFLTFAVTQI